MKMVQTRIRIHLSPNPAGAVLTWADVGCVSFFGATHCLVVLTGTMGHFLELEFPFFGGFTGQPNGKQQLMFVIWPLGSQNRGSSRVARCALPAEKSSLDGLRLRHAHHGGVCLLDGRIRRGSGETNNSTTRSSCSLRLE